LLGCAIRRSEFGSVIFSFQEQANIVK